jgi:hypothetical protein
LFRDPQDIRSCLLVESIRLDKSAQFVACVREIRADCHLLCDATTITPSRLLMLICGSDAFGIPRDAAAYRRFARHCDVVEIL